MGEIILNEESRQYQPIHLFCDHTGSLIIIWVHFFNPASLVYNHMGEGFTKICTIVNNDDETRYGGKDEIDLYDYVKLNHGNKYKEWFENELKEKIKIV